MKNIGIKLKENIIYWMTNRETCELNKKNTINDKKMNIWIKWKWQKDEYMNKMKMTKRWIYE